MNISKLLLRIYAKSGIFLRSVWKRLYHREMECPSCGCTTGQLCDRRFLVFSLVRCANCRLLSRRPADTDTESQGFYQIQYIEESVTDLPSATELKSLLESKFSTRYNYQLPIRILNSFGCSGGSKIIDFGCNWGYGSWQFREAGLKVTPVEISAARSDFARKHLGLPVLSHLEEIEHGATYDVFFSSHVLEHVANISSILDKAFALLRPGGLFVAVTPNGAQAFRCRNPDRWHQLWGRKHSNFLDEEFWHHLFRDWDHAVYSRDNDGSVQIPWEQLSLKFLKTRKAVDLSGGELIVAAVKPAR